MKLEAGKFYITRAGEKAKIYEIYQYKIHGAILGSTGHGWCLSHWAPDGESQVFDGEDIVGEWYDIQTRRLWINVYHNHETIFDDKAMADKNAGTTRVACIATEITFKQGDGL